MPFVPTTEQLQCSVSIITKVIAQIPYFHIFEESVAPLFPNDAIARSLRAMTRNAAMDSTLLNIRCFNEFFKPDGRRDDVRAYHFPGLCMEPFLTDDEVSSIDKYLAHITATRSDIVSKQWTLDAWIALGLTHGIEFLSFVDSAFSVSDETTRKEVRDVHTVLTRRIHKLIKQHEPQNFSGVGTESCVWKGDTPIPGGHPDQRRPER